MTKSIIPSFALFRNKKKKKKKNIQTALLKETSGKKFTAKKKKIIINFHSTLYSSKLTLFFDTFSNTLGINKFRGWFHRFDSIPGILSRFTTYLTYKPNLERKIRTGSPIGPGSPLAPFSPCNVKKTTK